MTEANDKPKRRGRPNKPHTPVRQIGRILDDEWHYLTEAARLTGLTWTTWSTRTLKKAAARIYAKQLRTRSGPSDNAQADDRLI